MLTEKAIYDIMRDAGVDATKIEGVTKAMSDLRKDAVPLRPQGTRMFDGGPFSIYTDEITSLMVSGGSPITRWIPTGTVKARNQEISHLSFVAPRGFTGADTYPDWLGSFEIPECGYGPSTSWSGFSYRVDGGSFSFTTDSMKPLTDGMKYFERQPIYSVRGGDSNLMISTDKEWAVARVLMVAEQHLDYVIKHGNRLNSDMEWDGLDQVLRVGYVASRVVGGGVASWADPLVINAASFTTVAQALTAVRIMVRRLRRYAMARNWAIRPEDMAIGMSATMWDTLAEYIAAGAMYNYTNVFGFTGQQNFSDFRQEYRATRQGGVGYGTIDVDGTPVPVLPDTDMGESTTMQVGASTVSAVTGDIYVLTRRAGGNILLEQQYVNWNELDYPAFDEDQFALQGGFVRAGWVTEANKCYYYYAEMAGRLVSFMQPMQGRINNVSIPLVAGDTNVANSFYASDWNAYNGLKGGQGNVLLNGLNL